MIHLLVAALFLVGNSGVAAVISMCCMDEDQVAMVSHHDDGCAEEGDGCTESTGLAISSPGDLCHTTEIVGGKRLDDVVLNPEIATERTSQVQNAIIVADVEAGYAPSASLRFISPVHPSAESPPLFLLNASLLI